MNDAPLVHIYAPRPVGRSAFKKICPDCKKESLMLAIHFEWHGADVTCLRCGRNWQDGEWMPLPFCRGARRQNIRWAKNRYRRAV